MNEVTYYKRIDVCRRLDAHTAVVYRCFELLPASVFVVQSADRVTPPITRDEAHSHSELYWELFIETAPEARGGTHPTLIEAIRAFDASFE